MFYLNALNLNILKVLLCSINESPDKYMKQGQFLNILK